MADLQLHHIHPPQQLCQPEDPTGATSRWKPPDIFPLGGAQGHAPPPDSWSPQQPSVQPPSPCFPLSPQHHLPRPVQQQVCPAGTTEPSGLMMQIRK